VQPWYEEYDEHAELVPAKIKPRASHAGAGLNALISLGASDAASFPDARNKAKHGYQCAGAGVSGWGGAAPSEAFDPEADGALAAPLLPELAPDDDPGGRSGGGGDVIEGEVGETFALFSLPGPTLPGFAVTPDAFALFAGGLDSSARAGATANSAAVAIAMQRDFIRWLLLA
jgi:hypothetical protein